MNRVWWKRALRWCKCRVGLHFWIEIPDDPSFCKWCFHCHRGLWRGEPPPPGHDSWLDYAVAHVGHELHPDRVTAAVESARAELDWLRSMVTTKSNVDATADYAATNCGELMRRLSE